MASTPNNNNTASAQASNMRNCCDHQNFQPTKEVTTPERNKGASNENVSDHELKTVAKQAVKPEQVRRGNPTTSNKAALNGNTNSASSRGNDAASAKTPLQGQATVNSKAVELINHNSVAGKQTKDSPKGLNEVRTENSSDSAGIKCGKPSDQTRSHEKQKPNNGSTTNNQTDVNCSKALSDSEHSDDDVIVGKDSRVSPAAEQKMAHVAASAKQPEQKQVSVRPGNVAKGNNVRTGIVQKRITSLAAKDSTEKKTKDDSALTQTPSNARPPIKRQQSERQTASTTSSSSSSSTAASAASASPSITGCKVAVHDCKDKGSSSNTSKGKLTDGTCSKASDNHVADSDSTSITGTKDSDSDSNMDKSVGNKSDGRQNDDNSCCSKSGEMAKQTDDTEVAKYNLTQRNGATLSGHANANGPDSQQQRKGSQELSQDHVKVQGKSSGTSDDSRCKITYMKPAEPADRTHLSHHLEVAGDDFSMIRDAKNPPAKYGRDGKENGKGDNERVVIENGKQDTTQSATGENKKLGREDRKDQNSSPGKFSNPSRLTDESERSTSGSRTTSSGSNNTAALSPSHQSQTASGSSTPPADYSEEENADHDKPWRETPSSVSSDGSDAKQNDHYSLSSSTNKQLTGGSDLLNLTHKSVMGASKDQDTSAKMVCPSQKIPAEHEKSSDKVEVDEVLWNYVRFADQRMEHLFTVETHPLDNRKVVLFGKPDDVQKFHKFCAAGRLQRCVKLQTLSIPKGYTATEFHSSLKDLAVDRIVVRLTEDWEFCELIGKQSDIDYVTSRSKDKLLSREVKDVRSESTIASSPVFKATYSSAVQSPTRMAPLTPVSHSHPMVFTAADNSFPFATVIQSTDFKLELSMLQSCFVVHILIGDILQQRCEVIVSPSNCAVDLKSGLSKAIASAAGPKLIHECQTIMRTKQFLEVGEVIDTTAGDISPPARRVIHACGPDRHNRRVCTGLDVCRCLLRKTFLTCLEHANTKLLAKSIVLPAISSGAFGVPPDVVAAGACEALIMFDEKFPKLPRSDQVLREITFVNNNSDITRTMVAKFKEMLLKCHPQSSRASSQIQNQAIKVYGHETSSISSNAEQLSYTKLQTEADRRGLCVVNIPKDGDSALHAIDHQLQIQHINKWTIGELRKQATAYMRIHPSVIDRTVLELNSVRDTTLYISRLEKPGTFCDLAMLRCVAEVIGKEVHVLYDNGRFEVLGVHSKSRGKPVFIGLVTESYYVSLRLKDPQSPSQSQPQSQHQTGVISSLQKSKYYRLQQTAENNGFIIAADQQDGDSLLQTIIEQLKDDGTWDYSVSFLRRKAVEYLHDSSAGSKKPKFLQFFSGDSKQKQSHRKKHSVPGAWCDETMLASVAEVICRKIQLLGESGSIKMLGPNSSFDQPVTVGVAFNGYYVGLLRNSSASGRNRLSLNSSSSSQRNSKAASPLSYSDDKKESDGGIEDDVISHGIVSTPGQSEGASPSPDKNADTDSCAICMDDVKNPKKLPCGHVFCTDCIEQSFSYQKKCPCCGKIFGELKGDQPDGGTMKVRTEHMDLPGYPGCGTIVIDYDIPNGRQKANHPNPGEWYQGARRTAYLPDNGEGREILELLRRAFDAGLIFTVGRSTTSGRENVVTWNDIHHKTKPNGPFGYPDPSYLSRVCDELAAKGIVRVKSGSTDSSLPTVPLRPSRRGSQANRSSSYT